MTKQPLPHKSAGFTLLEIAIVLFIVGLLIAGLLGPLETQLEARDRRQTLDTLNLISDALLGYAVTNGRLPCPAINGNGLSDPVFVPANPATANCSITDGFVPSVELGVPAVDAWGNRIRYVVSAPNYTLPEADGLCNGDTNPKHFDLCTKGTLTVKTRGDNPATPSVQEGKHLLTSATDLPAVLVSHGRNGNGATSVGGVTLPTPSGADEIENQNGNTLFIARGYSRGTSGCTDDENEGTALCEFDDIVVWLAPTVLNERVVNAGRLP